MNKSIVFNTLNLAKNEKEFANLLDVLGKIGKSVLGIEKKINTLASDIQKSVEKVIQPLNDFFLRARKTNVTAQSDTEKHSNSLAKNIAELCEVADRLRDSIGMFSAQFRDVSGQYVSLLTENIATTNRLNKTIEGWKCGSDDEKNGAKKEKKNEEASNTWVDVFRGINEFLSAVVSIITIGGWVRTRRQRKKSANSVDEKNQDTPTEIDRSQANKKPLQKIGARQPRLVKKSLRNNRSNPTRSTNPDTSDQDKYKSFFPGNGLVAGASASLMPSTAVDDIQKVINVLEKIPGIVEIASYAFSFLGKALSIAFRGNPIGFFISLLLDLVPLIIDNFDTIKEVLTKFSDWIFETFSKIWESVKEGFFGAINAIIDGIKNFSFKDIFGWFGGKSDAINQATVVSNAAVASSPGQTKSVQTNNQLSVNQHIVTNDPKAAADLARRGFEREIMNATDNQGGALAY